MFSGVLCGLDENKLVGAAVGEDGGEKGGLLDDGTLPNGMWDVIKLNVPVLITDGWAAFLSRCCPA